MDFWCLKIVAWRMIRFLPEDNKVAGAHVVYHSRSARNGRRWLCSVPREESTASVASCLVLKAKTAGFFRRRSLCGLICRVCPSRTSERGGEGDCVKEGGGEEGECERERTLGLLLCHSPRH